MKLSIITINFNNKNGLQKTIDSVLSQTWKDWEWILVDGGSTDGSKELLEKYQKYFAFWCSEPDSGRYNAINKGIIHAHGEYLNFMNSGDTYSANDTLEQVFSLDHTEDILYGNWNIVNGSDSLFKQSSPQAATLHRIIDNNICHQAMFIRRDFQNRHPYDESYAVLADWKCWIDSAIANCTHKYLPVTICDFDGAGISQSADSQCRKDFLRLHREYAGIHIINDELKKYNQDNILLDIYDLMHHNAFCLQIIHLTCRFFQLIMGIKPRR